MFENSTRILKKTFGLLVLTSVVILISILNYKPGTWLTGWDNLHPEFNFPLNIKRSLFAVWQEYQGLGLLGGMGHASDLPRQIFLWFASFVIPTHLLRYFYTFLMLLIGPLGVYYLILAISPRRSASAHHPRCLIAFSGALFYLLNLATMQTFYVPFSAFTTHYAFLPWLIYVLIRYLKKPTRRNLFWFFLVNLLAIPQAYIPTIFVVYLIAIAPFITTVSSRISATLLRSEAQLRRRRSSNTGVRNLLRRNVGDLSPPKIEYLGGETPSLRDGGGFIAFKRSKNLLLVIFCLNAFWFLPFLYFVFTNSGVVIESKINQMVSEEVFLRNKVFGNLPSVMLLKGFWFDTKDLNENGNFFFMLEPWIEHLKSPFILAIGYLFFVIILLGIIWSLKEKRNWIYCSFLFLFIFSFSMLAIATPPFSWINLILRKFVPFFSEVFRFPFTKFSILALFSYTIFFALGIEFIFLASFKLWKKLPILLTTICLILLAIFNFPSFQGNLIYKRARLKIPREYFDLFDFFKKQNPATRIANFPQAWNWGWSYYKWNYTGSGFLWYAVEQPILDRAFDVWSDKNEGYYWEVSHATYSHNLPLFENVLEKYQISWILIDENIYATGSPKALQIEALKEMLENSKVVSPVASFGKLKVYKVDLPIEAKNFVFFVDNPLRIEPTYKWANEDRAFAEHGIYYSSPITNYQLLITNYYYPFRELFTNNYVKDKNWWIEVKDQVISFKTKLPVDAKWTKESLNLNSLEKKEEKILLYRYGLEVYELPPQVDIRDNELEVQVPKYNLLRPEDVDFTQKIGRKETCNQLKEGEYDLEIIEEEKKFLRLSSKNTSSCTSFNYSYFDHDYSYLLEIESRNVKGKELFFYALNETTKKGELEVLPPKSKNWAKSYYILPPKNPYGRGYGLHFDNISIGNEETINDIRDIKIFPIPFDFLKNLKIQPTSEVGEKLLLVYSQSFDPGWKLLGVKNAKHVLVNNWANGWIIDKSNMKYKKLKIIYLPQLLEYLGFLLLLAFPIQDRFRFTILDRCFKITGFEEKEHRRQQACEKG